jgi:FAD/FMN-containing dehydrogenase
MKQLFIGSEGTLGIITAAALKLWPEPQGRVTMFAGLGSPQAAVELLANLRGALGDRVLAFELISDRCLRLVERHIAAAKVPVDVTQPWYVLAEVEAAEQDEELEQALAGELDAGTVEDVVIAKNESESQNLWRVRHSLSEAQNPEGSALKHDISVPTGRIATFVSEAAQLVATQAPGARVVAFGHIGDGNLHYDILQPPGSDGQAFVRDGLALTEALYDLATGLGGSFSAEHGVGLFKKAYLERYRGGVEINLMRATKAALDPANILNPGKVI